MCKNSYFFKIHMKIFSLVSETFLQYHKLEIKIKHKNKKILSVIVCMIIRDLLLELYESY